MRITFTKYHGTGNDFIMVDCTKKNNFKLTSSQIRFLCHRHFGIGADGVILIFKHSEYDFLMDYYNADGTQSFCGNGARCAVHFAKQLNLIKQDAAFLAIDGKHEAAFNDEIISLKMGKVSDLIVFENDYIIDTGSPHYIRFTDNVEHEDMIATGKSIRYSDKFKENGINVNLVEVVTDDYLKMRTYERGVEGETLSCGTGAVAAALTHAITKNLSKIDIEITVRGGKLNVKAEKKGSNFEKVFLTGSATKIFNGEIEI